MGYMIFTTVDTAAIENHGELNISVEGGIHSINKRSPIFNPLFPVKYPLTLVASKIYSNKIGWLLNKVPGINVIQSLFWGKKGLLALGKWRFEYGITLMFSIIGIFCTIVTYSVCPKTQPFCVARQICSVRRKPVTVIKSIDGRLDKKWRSLSFGLTVTRRKNRRPHSARARAINLGS